MLPALASGADAALLGLEEVTESQLLDASSRVRDYLRTYMGRDFDGATPPPEGVVRIVCQVAARLNNQGAAILMGISQETSGSESRSYGWDAYQAVSGLTRGEKQALRDAVPKYRAAIVLEP